MEKTNDSINVNKESSDNSKRNRRKYVLYTMCIFLLCLIDQRIGSMSGEGQLVFPNCVGIVTGLLVLSQYSVREFMRKPYFVWGGICLVGIPATFIWVYHNVIYIWQWNSAVVVVALYGFLIIRGVIGMTWDKKSPGKKSETKPETNPVTKPEKKPLMKLFKSSWRNLSQKLWMILPMNPWILIGYLLLLILMNLSMYDGRWPLLYLLVFGGFYLTGLRGKDCRLWITALMDGVILAFFIFQGLAFVFRPYDTLRYHGLYANTNMNALFYQMVYCAFLSKFCMAEKRYQAGEQTRKQTVFKWIHFAFACAMWSFVLLTMCRSAMVGMAVVFLLAVCYCMSHGTFGMPKGTPRMPKGTPGTILRKGNVVKKLLRYMILPCIVVVLSFPVVYCAVRYIPAVFHHPVWFYNEYSEDKVHSWDSYDSPKYTDWQDVLSGNFGRIMEIFKPGLQVNAAVSEIEPEPTANISSTSYRMNIYKHYFKAMNFRGHAEDEHGIWLDESYTAPHAHNLFLQYGFNFGILAGILFIVLSAATGIRLLYLVFYKKRNQDDIVLLLFYAAILAFGMTEIVWRNGQFSNTMLYLLPFFAWHQTSAPETEDIVTQKDVVTGNRKMS